MVHRLVVAFLHLIICKIIPLLPIDCCLLILSLFRTHSPPLTRTFASYSRVAHPDPLHDGLSHAHTPQPLYPNKCYLPNPQALRSHFHHRVSNCSTPIVIIIITFVYPHRTGRVRGVDVDVGFARA
ncbi:hypothetical protein BJ165DRAFT_1483012 [Panaeolus papilionaceus]|nr:hypothetical protein BJ165DRAFT_1483012 [Panaeolus papilionaceus]